jgi:tetratricopeptide (TPR) repeat protein
LAGDLDTITLKALRKSPADRYATVPALADDIERFLDGRPVLAQPDRAWYRARKFAARNRIAVTATAAVLLALAAGIAATTWQAVEARRERDSALFQAERELAKGSMFTLLLGALGSAEHPLTQREILERSVTLVESRFRDDPRIAIDLLLPIAGQYMTLGESQKELDVEQRAFTLAQTSGDPALIALVACNTVETDIALGRLEAAREQLRIGQQALGQLSRPELGTVTDCLNADAEVARASADADRAIDRINEAVLRYEAAGKTRSNRYTSLLAKLSLAYRMQGNPRASYAVLEKLDRADQSAGIPDSADAVARRRDEAQILIDLGEYRAAERVLDKVVARLEQARGAATSPSWLAYTRGVLLLELGDFERARGVLEAATAQARAEGGTQKALPIDYALARALAALGRYDEAEHLLAGVEAGLAAAPDRYRSIAPAALRAQMLLARGATTEAVRTIEAELSRLGYPGVRDSNQLAAALLTAADAHLAAGDAPRARDLATAGVEVTQRIARDATQSAAVGRAMLVLARTQRSLGETSTAAATARHAEAGLATGLGNDHPLTLEARALAGS